MKKEYSLLIKTNSYTGNTDSFILAALFGINDGRYGAKKGILLFDEYISYGNENFIDFVSSRPVEEYGYCYYQINNDFCDGYNTLEVFIDEYAVDRVPEVVKAIKAAYPNGIVNASLDGNTFVVELLGFHLKTLIINHEIEEI